MLVQQSKFSGIQALRAIAALLVLLQHTLVLTTSAVEQDYLPYLLFSYGSAGVFLFFVISGFVMAKCMREKRFLFNRFIRIYPSYWLTILISFVLVSTFSPWSFHIKSFFLIKIRATYPIPYWTLIYEVFFYGIIYLFSKASKNNEQVFYLSIGWLIVIFLFNQHQPVATLTPIKLMIFSPINYFFITGLIFSLYKEKIQKIPSNLMLLLGFILWMISLNYIGNMYIVTALSYGFIVLSLYEKLNQPWLCKLGDYSYGIYLVHMSIILCTNHVLLAYYPNLSLKVLFPVTALITFVFSCLFGYFETRLHVYLKTKLKNQFRKKTDYTENLNYQN